MKSIGLSHKNERLETSPCISFEGNNLFDYPNLQAILVIHLPRFVHSTGC